jgi:diadenosine tetraphosphatase ApaH/serine/threonine PP2A family protein phosphatase
LRLGIVSDLHANREALEAVWQHLEGQSVDELVCLGDVVGYGPDPEFCVDLVRGHASWCLMGNHDEALHRDAADFNSYARQAIEYTRRRMRPRWWSSAETKARWRYLENLPLSRQIGRFHFFHGSPRDPVREYVLSTDGLLNPEKLRGIFAAFEGVAFAGHTHQPGYHDEDLRWHGLSGQQTVRIDLPPGRKAFVNVGSVGQPRDGDHRACYAVLEEEALTWHRVEYDYRRTQDKILQSGALPEVLARRLAVGR